MSGLAAARRLAGALLAALASACARPQAWPPEPAALRAGEEACAGCRMLVSDERFAVQAHGRDGSAEWFDDLGCLLAADRPDLEPEGVFARDFGAEAWVRGDRGFAVRVPGLDSPMGHGWTVHGSEAEARAAAGAELAVLSELLSRGLPGGRPPDTRTAVTGQNEDP